MHLFGGILDCTGFVGVDTVLYYIGKTREPWTKNDDEMAADW